MTTEEKLKPLMDEIDSYKKKIFDFDREENDFIPAQHNPKEEGYYITIRCGLSGIYQMLNEWKDNKWQINLTDGSYTIAYNRKRIYLKNLK